MIKETVTFFAVQFRIARPANDLDGIVHFYKEGLGLPELGSFKDHEGYSGVMLGLPDASHHLEFTQQKANIQLPKPDKENLLVLYFDRPEHYKDANQRLRNFGAKEVEPENPYWLGKSTTYEDPEGWRVLLFNGVYKPVDIPDDRIAFIDNTYALVENRLTQDLKLENFYRTDFKFYYEAFGSRYSIWKNYKKLIAIRLVWDGRDQLFRIEGSPFLSNNEPIAWADIAIVPFEASKISSAYQQQIIDDLINEIK